MSSISEALKKTNIPSIGGASPGLRNHRYPWSWAGALFLAALAAAAGLCYWHYRMEAAAVAVKDHPAPAVEPAGHEKKILPGWMDPVVPDPRVEISLEAWTYEFRFPSVQTKKESPPIVIPPLEETETARPAADAPPPSAGGDSLDNFMAGFYAQEDGLYEQAVHLYRLAIKQDPKMVEAYLNLGNLFFENQRNPEQAEEMYKQVLKLSPDNKLAHNNLGVLFLRKGLLSQALVEFSTAIEQDRDYVDAIYNMACLAARQGRKTLAVSYLLRAGRLDPRVSAWAADDRDLASLHDNPTFEDFIKKGVSSGAEGNND